MKRFALPVAVLLAALGACTDDDKRQAVPTEPTVAPSASRAAAAAAPKSSVCLAVEQERESRRVIANKTFDVDAAAARNDVSEMDALIADACQ